MPDSLTEMIAAQYYRFKGYLVEPRVQFVGDPQGKKCWRDLDLLAIKDEVVLVNCKDAVNTKDGAEAIIANLQFAEKHVKTRYADLVGNKKIRRELICGTFELAGGQGGEGWKKLADANIRCIEFQHFFRDYLEELAKFMDAQNQGGRKAKGRHRAISATSPDTTNCSSTCSTTVL